MKPKLFIVRKNCEYSIAVEAKDEQEAIVKAITSPDHEWDQAWSPVDAEEE